MVSFFLNYHKLQDGSDWFCFIYQYIVIAYHKNTTLGAQ